jgi:hypothetical protein
MICWNFTRTALTRSRKRGRFVSLAALAFVVCEAEQRSEYFRQRRLRLLRCRGDVFLTDVNQLPRFSDQRFRERLRRRAGGQLKGDHLEQGQQRGALRVRVQIQLVDGARQGGVRLPVHPIEHGLPGVAVIGEVALAQRGFQGVGGGCRPCVRQHPVACDCALFFGFVDRAADAFFPGARV